MECDSLMLPVCAYGSAMQESDAEIMKLEVILGWVACLPFLFKFWGWREGEGEGREREKKEGDKERNVCSGI